MSTPVKPPKQSPSFSSLDPELQRGRLKFEGRITLLSLAAGFPAVGLCAFLLWYDGYSAQVQWTIDLFLVLLWLGISFNLKQRIVRPLQTLSNILAAKDAGAIVVNHAEAMRPISRDRDQWCVKVHDDALNADFDVRASVIVNATGPWRLNLERRWPQHRAQRRGSKGVHIALPQAAIGNHGALTILSPDDGRVMFILPAGQFTIVGTTDRWTNETPEEVRASTDDIRYLLRAANAYYPEAHLTEGDVVSAWAGIRPLAEWDPDKSPSEFSREHRINRNGAGMITVSGGKLTTYRAMAEEIVNAVEHELGRKPTKCMTGVTDLPGGERNGAVAEMINADSATGACVVPGLPYTIADLRYSIEHEMALTLSDLLMRRTRIAFETPDHGASVAPAVADAVAGVANWDKHQRSAQIDAYLDDSLRVFGIEP